MSDEGKIIGEYLRTAEAVPANSTEATFRTPLENLLNGLAKAKDVRTTSGDIKIIHEPSQTKGVGTPDFMLLNDGGAIIGYVECKKPGEKLDDTIASEQIKKYGELSDNALITDYWRFILLQGNNPPREVDLSAKSARTAENKDALCTLITDFMCAEVRKIDDPQKLAEILAGRCRALRDEMEKEMSGGFETSKTSQELWVLLNSFREVLFHEITPEDFADTLAQTVTYTLLFAKLNSQTEEELTMPMLKRHIPENFDVIRGISGFLDSIEDTPTNYLLQSILAVINAIDPLALTEKAGKEGGTDEDPYFYFYENFLAAYSPQTRESRGVYYTPPPAVKFIVRATDDILQRDFGKPSGLADSSVTALDFAAGTGTFMLEIIRRALDNKSKSKRDSLARGHLLKNVYGFEFLISSYVIAHLKIAAFYKEMGIELKDNERINIFLTNTLEPNTKQVKMSIIPALAREIELAQKIKEKKILVITGNPPYSGHAQTPGSEVFMRPAKRPSQKDPTRMVKDVRDTWIGGLLRDYYEVDGKSLGEKNLKWLQDDYVKFIRFAQHKIDNAGQGVVAIITNHGFLDNPTFRGMRESLLQSFDRLYFLDVHGNSRIKEKTPDGSRDENIFDIQQGVAISLLVKKKGLEKGVFHADLWGLRKGKEAAFLESSVDSLKWKKLNPASPSYFFIPQDEKASAKYQKGYPITDIFSDKCQSTGIFTARDSLTMGFTANDVRSTIKKFADMPEEEAREFFNLGADMRDWKVSLAQKDLQDSGLDRKKIHPVAYRPFDTRHTYYTGKSRGFHCMPRGKVMRNMIAGDNIALVTIRRVPNGRWQHAFVSDKITDLHYQKEGGYVLPLYFYEESMGKVTRHENFQPEFRKWIDARYGKAHTPEDILGCIYAILNAPAYRERYMEFLSRDYPRIPFPADNKSFRHLANIGKELINAHLLLSHFDGKIELQGSGTSHKVKEISYDEKQKRLYFNDDEYLAPVSPEVANYEVGSYHPLAQYLKYRKGRKLSSADIETLEKAANAIAYTVKTIKKIKLP